MLDKLNIRNMLRLSDSLEAEVPLSLEECADRLRDLQPRWWQFAFGRYFSVYLVRIDLDAYRFRLRKHVGRGGSIDIVGLLVRCGSNTCVRVMGQEPPTIFDLIGFALLVAFFLLASYADVRFGIAGISVFLTGYILHLLVPRREGLEAEVAKALDVKEWQPISNALDTSYWRTYQSSSQYIFIQLVRLTFTLMVYGQIISLLLPSTQRREAYCTIQPRSERSILQSKTPYRHLWSMYAPLERTDGNPPLTFAANDLLAWPCNAPTAFDLRTGQRQMTLPSIPAFSVENGLLAAHGIEVKPCTRVNRVLACVNGHVQPTQAFLWTFASPANFPLVSNVVIVDTAIYVMDERATLYRLDLYSGMVTETIQFQMPTQRMATAHLAIHEDIIAAYFGDTLTLSVYERVRR